MKAYIALTVGFAVSSVAAPAVEKLSERALRLTDGKYGDGIHAFYPSTHASV